MPEVHYRLLLADANILIDLIHTEQLAVLSLLRNALGIKVYVADCAVQELSQERLAAPLESFGVTVVRTEDGPNYYSPNVSGGHCGQMINALPVKQNDRK